MKPWTIYTHVDAIEGETWTCVGIKDDSETSDICLIEHRGHAEETVLKHARLISAAPEMLEALIKLNEFYRPEQGGPAEEHQLGVLVERLISKITGGDL